MTDCPSLNISFMGLAGPPEKISAKSNLNIDQLKNAIFRKIVSGGGQWSEEGCLPNVRHKRVLVLALGACQTLITSLKSGNTNDLLSVDLQECLDLLAEIVGETTTEDILDVIFEQFCLGK